MKKIAITGPESTGKSMLAENLARHFNTVWVPEYAREYLEKIGRSYEEGDVLEIARGQLENERRMAPKASDYLFCDTEAIVTKIWSEVRYGRCHPEILQMIGDNPYDLYLLCDIDLPWSYDPLREHPHYRKELFDLYFRELTKRNLSYGIVSGMNGLRLQQALNIITVHF